MLQHQFQHVTKIEITLFQKENATVPKMICCTIHITYNYDRGNHTIVSSKISFESNEKLVQVYYSISSTVNEETGNVIKKCFED